MNFIICLGPLLVNLISAIVKATTPYDVFKLLFEVIIDEWKTISQEILIRNYIIGPITEEIVFRSIIISSSIVFQLRSSNTLHSNNTSIIYNIIWYSPIYFGLAHIHHLYESIRQGKPIVQSITIIMFQLTYTSIFGIIAGILYIRTGTIISCIRSHVIYIEPLICYICKHVRM